MLIELKPDAHALAEPIDVDVSPVLAQDQQPVGMQGANSDGQSDD